MSEIKTISADELRDMEDKEGLILQGCGGEPEEWVDGINEMLAKEDILKDSSRFEKAMVFEHDGLTNLLFPFEGIKLDMGKLAMWRLRTHEVFGGTWLSDYVPNRLGGFGSQEPLKKERPRMPLEGMDGNIFFILGTASQLLQRNGQDDEARKMYERVTSSGSYDEALNIISEYVETELSPVADLRASKRQKKAKTTREER